VKLKRLFFRAVRAGRSKRRSARETQRGLAVRSCENAIRRCLKVPYFVSPRRADLPPDCANARPVAATVEINQGTFDETWSEQ
jgi:hypothetical protein